MLSSPSQTSPVSPTFQIVGGRSGIRRYEPKHELTSALFACCRQQRDSRGALEPYGNLTTFDGELHITSLKCVGDDASLMSTHGDHKLSAASD